MKATIQELITEATKDTSKILGIEINQETYKSLHGSDYGSDYVLHGYTGVETVTIKWYNSDQRD